MPNSLSLVWGHLVHFAKFQFYNFQNSAPPSIFIQFHPNFTQGIINRGQYRILLFGDLPQIKKKYGIFKCFLTQDDMQLEI